MTTKNNDPFIPVANLIPVTSGAAGRLPTTLGTKGSDVMEIVKVVVDWGDGQDEEHPGGPKESYAHTYEKPGNYIATMTLHATNEVRASVSMVIGVGDDEEE